MNNLNKHNRPFLRKKVSLEKTMVREDKDADHSVPFLTAKELYKDRPAYTN